MTHNPVTPTLENAFCLGCGYALRDLPSRTCPECGRPFDAADPRTMSLGHPLRPWQRWLLRPTGWPIIALPLLGTAGLIYLSRWPSLSPEPASVLASEFRWLPSYMAPPTAADMVFYTAVALWVTFVAWVVVWQLARLLLAPRVGRSATMCAIDARYRRGTIAVSATVSVLFMIFGWEQRVGIRWIARAMAQTPGPQHNPVWEPWYGSPVELSDEQAQEVLSHLVINLRTPNERLAALRMLVEGAGREALPSVVHAATMERDESLLAWELRFIGLCRDPQTAPLLISKLRDPRAAVRGAAADAIGILRRPSYSIAADAPYFICDPLELDTIPPIDLNRTLPSRLDRPNASKDSDLMEGPDIPIPLSVRSTLESMMSAGKTVDEREAAARALVAWPPDHFQFRVAEWGVWIESRGHMALAKSILDEIPPFVHRTGNPISSLEHYFLYPMDVTKPIIHVTSDVMLSADVEIQISEGRPWFAYPKPDDFGIGIQPETKESKAFQAFYPRELMTPAVSSAITPLAADDYLAPPIPTLSDCREGYPWLAPHHRLYHTTRQGDPEIFRLGLRWQSLVVSPSRLSWMCPPPLPKDPKYRWWERLRDVPSCWVSSRGEAERFLYYDGPSQASVPITAYLVDSGKRLRLARIPTDSVPTIETGEYGVELRNLMHPMILQSRSDVPEHEGMYIEVCSGRVSGQAVEISGKDSVVLTLDPALVGEAAVSARLREMILRYGLTGPEADGLIAAWAPQFFRADGRRFLLRMSPAEYARQCPMQVRPTPTEVVRLGLVLTEFDPR